MLHRGNRTWQNIRGNASGRGDGEKGDIFLTKIKRPGKADREGIAYISVNMYRETKKMYHHTLDPFPKPKDESHLYVNEPWLIDGSWIESDDSPKYDRDRDNVRIYVPLDLSRDLILRRLEHVILRYGEANEENESNFSADVDAIILQIEIYDQVWYVRHMPENDRHSAEAIELVREFVSRLEEMPDGCAECFPFETIEELKTEYLES